MLKLSQNAENYLIAALVSQWLQYVLYQKYTETALFLTLDLQSILTWYPLTSLTSKLSLIIWDFYNIWTICHTIIGNSFRFTACQQVKGSTAKHTLFNPNGFYRELNGFICGTLHIFWCAFSPLSPLCIGGKVLGQSSPNNKAIES